jgi:glycosyltransferase involved in cell wall biosynthesis
MKLKRITIDLTPMLPGGDNGGAKLVACSLVRHLADLASETEFILLTSAISHDELASLDAPNVRRHCVDADLSSVQVESGKLGSARVAARVLVNTLVPAGARDRVKDGVWSLVKRQRRARIARSEVADLHFAPFTAPFFFDPNVPLVALVHDLQFIDLPQFFDEDSRVSREQHFRDACDKADRLICVSEFVRQTVLSNSRRSPDSVTTIHSTVLHATRADADGPSTVRRVLSSFGTRSSRYLLYPANAWPHKNHRRLVQAFAQFLTQRPDSDLALVCTGAPSAAFDELQAYARASLPPGSFTFAGYLSEPDYAAVLQNARALIFPSLYEGFGLPVLEAMARGCPVLSSNAASLPEISGDAALLFDPRDPASIHDAIERVETDPVLARALTERGRQRAERFGSERDMAARYLAVFEDVRSNRAAG